MYTIKGTRHSLAMKLCSFEMPSYARDVPAIALVVEHPTDLRAILEILETAQAEDLPEPQANVLRQWITMGKERNVKYFEVASDGDIFFRSAIESAFLRADPGSACEWNANEILFQIDARLRSQLSDDFEMRFSMQTPGGRSDDPIPSIRLMSPPSPVRH